MPVKLEEYNHVCVMTPAGDFVAAEAEAARKSIEALSARKRVPGVVVDCEKVSFIDSEGLATLLWMKHKTDEVRGQFKIANLGDNCRKILQVTRLEHRFECHCDLATALRAMRC